MPLEKTGDRQRHWALSLEAFRRAQNAQITETSEGLDIAGLRIPASRDGGRLLRIRYLPPDAGGQSRIPQVTLQQVLKDPAAAQIFKDKIVFVGATDRGRARDGSTSNSVMFSIYVREVVADSFVCNCAVTSRE